MYQWKKLQYIVWFVTDIHWYQLDINQTSIVFLYQLDIKRWLCQNRYYRNQSLLHPCNMNSSNQHSHPGHSHLSQGATDCRKPGGRFTNVSRALQNNLAKIYNARNNIYAENFKLKLCTCAQSMALGTHTKFQPEILIRMRFWLDTNFERIFWRARKTLVKHPPAVTWHTTPPPSGQIDPDLRAKYSAGLWSPWLRG